MSIESNSEQKTVTREAVEAVRADTTRTEGSKYDTPEYRALMAEVTKESDAAKGIVREYVIAEEAPKVPAEVIHALRNLRAFAQGERRDVSQEINILDNAGIFAAIDEATGYDVDPEPERVSKCTCPPSWTANEYHAPRCPGDPAEWGDMAFTTARDGEMSVASPEYIQAVNGIRRSCPAGDCTLDFAVNADGTLHKHLNDSLRACPGTAPNPKENNCE